MTPRNLQITFHLDGTGVYYDPNEPPMLDALLAAIRVRHHVSGEPPAKDEPPFEVPLPLAKQYVGNHWFWKASALFPIEDEAMQHVVYWRKRFRQNRAEMTEGSPNLTNGTYRDWNTPVPLLLTSALRGWCVYTGDRKPSKLRQDLEKDVRYIGKKRAHGRGQVTRVTVEMIEEDWSVSKDGLTTRYVPDENAFRNVRPRPPYWNLVGATLCKEIGTPITL